MDRRQSLDQKMFKKVAQASSGKREATRLIKKRRSDGSKVRSSLQNSAVSGCISRVDLSESLTTESSLSLSLSEVPQACRIEVEDSSSNYEEKLAESTSLARYTAP